MSPQTPVLERPAPMPPAETPQRPPVTMQPSWPAHLPYGWPSVPQYPRQRDYTIPTAGQRLGLAITTLILMIPFIAIALGVVGTASGVVAGGWALAGGLLATLVVCLAAVAINVVFNFDILRPRR